MKTPQFWLLFGTSSILATGGVGLMSVARPMVSEVFAGALPHVVTASFASSFLMAMAAGNLAGRIGWSTISDKIGRRNTFTGFAVASVPIYMSFPTIINAVVQNQDNSLGENSKERYRAI